MNADIGQPSDYSFDKVFPSVLLLLLWVHQDLHRVCLVVHIQCVDSEHILEVERISFSLEWEVNEYIPNFLVLELGEVCFKEFRLSLFLCLRNNDRVLDEGLLLNCDVVSLKCDDIESLECWIAWTWRDHTS